jgi:hypothetical protein
MKGSSLVSSTIANLVNGVSQQPAVLRFASQCDEQVNGYSTVVDGLSKRPSMRHIAKLIPGTFGPAFHHTINRDASERYKVVVTSAAVRVFDLNGVEKTVNAPDGFGYLGGVSDPAQDFSITTVADYTFIVNRTKVAKADPALGVTRNPEALVWFRSGDYGSTYAVTVDGASYSYKTLPGGQSTDIESTQTEFIAKQIYDLMVADTDITDKFNVSVVSSVIHLQVKNAGDDFTISHKDGKADTAIRTVKGTINSFANLPPHAAGGRAFLVKVSGGASSTYDDYYVRYNADDGNATSGVWTEVRKGGEKFRFDAATMPHVLVRESDGTFTFKPADWDQRNSGDSDTNPFPSFVNKRISSVFFHRNRLGFLSGENAILSKAGEFFSFFKDSGYELVDSDPIDVAATHVEVAELRHAVPFNETLMIFADQAQFTLTGGDLLTPKTAAINLATEFKADLRARPAGAGRNIYFATSRGTSAGVREYYVDRDTATKDAAEITAHVPSYVKGEITRLAASSNDDVLIALTTGSPSTAYIYKFYAANGDKLQSSWSKWTFEGASLLSMDFIQSTIYVAYEFGGATYLGAIDLSVRPIAAFGGAFDPLVDHRFDQTAVSGLTYNAVTDQTTFTVPFAIDADDWRVIAWEDPIFKDGVTRPFTASVGTGTTAITTPGHLTKFLFGRSYELRYRFSTLILRPSGGQTAITNGRVQCRRMRLSFASTGYFRVEVTPVGRDTFSYAFTGRTMGKATNVIGSPGIETGEFSCPLMGRNDDLTVEVVNDSILPSYLLEATWEALFSPQSRRL